MRSFVEQCVGNYRQLCPEGFKFKKVKTPFLEPSNHLLRRPAASKKAGYPLRRPPPS